MAEKITMSLPEFAQKLGISKSLAYKMAGNGEIPGLIKLGAKRLVISVAAVDRMLEAAGE